MKLLKILPIFCILLVILNLSIVNALPNPAAVYCKELGYDYKIVETSLGEKGICVLPDKACDGWGFFKGVCGQEYSYCAKQGYDIKTKTDGKNPYSSSYSVCVYAKGKDKGKEVSSVTNLMKFSEILKGSIEITGEGGVTESESTSAESATTTTITTVESTEKICCCDFYIEPDCSTSGWCEWDSSGFGCPSQWGECPAEYCPVDTTTTTLPSSFDWRNKDGGDWTTPVKNQGFCGSCWAFAAVGTVDAKINIVNNDPDLDYDISEQDLVSCFPYGDCSGGNVFEALNYFKSTGVVDEECFPYSASELPCSDMCSAPTHLWKIDDFIYNDHWEGPGGDEKGKIGLVNKGPIGSALYMHGYFDEDGIYRCEVEDYTTPPDHAIAIVGYNDIGGYWIAKNSWGSTWNGDGYFNVGYGECFIFTASLMFGFKCKWYIETPYDDLATTTTTTPCKGYYETCTQSSECCSPYYCYAGRCRGGGGCPILKVWDGKEFVKVEKLNIHAHEGVDTEVQTSFTMQPIEEGVYKIILKEASYWSPDDDGSNIDHVKLTTEDGRECELISATHNKDGDATLVLRQSDDLRVRSDPDEEISLVYECSGNSFTLAVEGYNPLRVKKSLSEIALVPIVLAGTAVLIMFGFLKFFAKKK